jgi:SAM-dependent methyltransferase
MTRSARPVPRTDARGEYDYLPTMSPRQYREFMARRHRDMAELLDLSDAAVEAARPWLRSAAEFGDDPLSGRGGSYRDAQRDRCARARGIMTLLSLSGHTTGRAVVIDVLGGNGTVTQVWRRRAGAHAARLRILTCDVSAPMVTAALADGLPALRQPAQRMLLRDRCADLVLFAYGTHHLSARDRPRALAEAWRVLRPGGSVVVHDFPHGSAAARWFAEVVHPYSKAGHDHAHFDGAEMRTLLTTNGFTAVETRLIYDPFELSGPSPEQARSRLARHLRLMYGLHPPGATDDSAADEWVAERMARYFRLDSAGPAAVTELSVRPAGGAHTAELPRAALVAVGRKPDGAG